MFFAFIVLGESKYQKKVNPYLVILALDLPGYRFPQSGFKGARKLSLFFFFFFPYQISMQCACLSNRYYLDKQVDMDRMFVFTMNLTSQCVWQSSSPLLQYASSFSWALSLREQTALPCQILTDSFQRQCFSSMLEDDPDLK